VVVLIFNKYSIRDGQVEIIRPVLLHSITLQDLLRFKVGLINLVEETTEHTPAIFLRYGIRKGLRIFRNGALRHTSLLHYRLRFYDLRSRFLTYPLSFCDIYRALPNIITLARQVAYNPSTKTFDLLQYG
jgi:hypothetical protein